MRNVPSAFTIIPRIFIMIASAPARSTRRRTASTLIAAEMIAPIAPLQLWDEPVAPVSTSEPQACNASAQAGINAASPLLVLVAAFFAMITATAAIYFVARIAFRVAKPIIKKAAAFVVAQMGTQASPQSWVELKDLLGHA
jgi:hypothetical protein